jgi:hypothetical protein
MVQLILFCLTGSSKFLNIGYSVIFQEPSNALKFTI